MSKTSLKKELTSMTKEQIIEVVLEMYGARKDFKEYFEYYLNPKPEKLLDKYNELIKKEMRRSKWSNCKARVSQLKNHTSMFESFSPDYDTKYKFYVNSMVQFLFNEKFVDMSESHIKWFEKTMTDFLDMNERNLRLDEGIKFLLENLKPSNITSHYMERVIENHVKHYIEDKSM